MKKKYIPVAKEPRIKAKSYNECFCYKFSLLFTHHKHESGLRDGVRQSNHSSTSTLLMLFCIIHPSTFCSLRRGHW